MIYVMSDIHGCYKEFKKMLKLIKFSKEDTLYILGDTIDRGPEPLSVLLYTSKEDNIHLIMGNHEVMMRDALLSGDYSLWYRNGGAITCKQFNSMSKEEQIAILEYISDLPLYETITVNDKNYYLAHSTFKKEESEYYCNHKQEENDVVWTREYKEYPYINKLYPETYRKYNGYTFIGGHTPTIKILQYECFMSNKPYKSHIYKGKHYINVDCGMACNSNSDIIIRLGCLRLNDMKEFYIEKM